MALLKPTLAYDDLRDADLVIEAVFEDMAIKRDGVRDARRVAKPGAILATNTSTLDVDRDRRRRPSARRTSSACTSSVPANVMKLLEVVRGARDRRTTCWRP